MTRTDVLVRREFQSWFMDRLQEEAERKEQTAWTRTGSSTLSWMSRSVLTGLSLIALAASSIL